MINIKKIIKFYFSLLAIALLLGNIDFELCKKSGAPKISIPVAACSCGDNQIYLGVGYFIKTQCGICPSENQEKEYSVGPIRLQPWNIFEIFGARKLLNRFYSKAVWNIDEDDGPEKLYEITEDEVGQRILWAILDLLPLATLLAFFVIWKKIKRNLNQGAHTIPHPAAQSDT